MVNGARLGRIFRAVRIRLGLRQVDVAQRAGVSDSAVSRIERGRLYEISFATLQKVADMLEIRLDIVAWWRGGDLDRMVNAKHAALAEDVVASIVEQRGWEVRPEVSFSIGRERGVIDLLAWHAATRTLLVIELKTDIVDVGELLGTFDRKRRLATQVASELGWHPDRVALAVLVREGRTNRRRVAAHERTLRAALPDDGRRFRALLVSPEAQVSDPERTRRRQEPPNVEVNAALDDAALARELATAGRARLATPRATPRAAPRSLEVLAALAFVPYRQQATTRQAPATNRRVRVPRKPVDVPG